MKNKATPNNLGKSQSQTGSLKENSNNNTAIEELKKFGETVERLEKEIEEKIIEEIAEEDELVRTPHPPKASKRTILWTLFKSMFILSACTFGGGFVIVSLMKNKYVDELKWLDDEEMLDVTAITQSCPGPLPVNASVIIGYRMAGILGSLVAVLGSILPPMIIISIISVFYNEFRTNPYIATALQVMRAGVAAVIFDVVINLTKNVCKTRRVLYIAMMIISFVCAYFLNVSAMLIILSCLAIGFIDLAFSLTKQKKEVFE